MKKEKILILVSFIAAIVFFIGLAIDNQTIRIFSKPIPVFILAVLLIGKKEYKKFIFFGFVFSVLGDIFLELPYDLFIFGLGSFLIGHIFYIVAFTKRSQKKEFLALTILLLIGMVIFIILYKNLGEMKISVAAYMLVILIMVWRAWCQKSVNKLAIWGFIGAVLFLISDANIAFNKFCCHYAAADWVIMILYWAGQYLIYYSTRDWGLVAKE